MVLKKILLICAVICGSAARAAENPAKDKMENVKVAPLLVMIDGDSRNILDFEYDKNGNPTHLLYETQDGKTKEITKFTMKQLESEGGAALGQEFGVVGLAVRAKFNSSTGRGHITFKFVNNGANMFNLKHRECSGMLMRSPQTKHWELFKPGETQPVTAVELVQWSLGLTTLKGLCPEKYDQNDPPPEGLMHSPAEEPAGTSR